MFCQEDRKDSLHDVTSKNMGTQLLNIGKETSIDLLKVRLSPIVCSNDLLTAVSEEMKYHLPCLIKAKRHNQKSKQNVRGECKFWKVIVRS